MSPRETASHLVLPPRQSGSHVALAYLRVPVHADGTADSPRGPRITVRQVSPGLSGGPGSLCKAGCPRGCGVGHVKKDEIRTRGSRQPKSPCLPHPKHSCGTRLGGHWVCSHQVEGVPPAWGVHTPPIGAWHNLVMERTVKPHSGPSPPAPRSRADASIRPSRTLGSGHLLKGQCS